MSISRLNIHNQKGLSLVEILVTTLVLGIGLLGVAVLQVSSISGNQEGFFTSQATSIAEDLASRIRSAQFITVQPDEDARLDYEAYIALYVTKEALLCNIDKNCQAEVCSVEEMALFDKAQICNIADNTLPGGKVRIKGATDGNRLTIVVDWDSASARGDIGNLENINVHCEGITSSDSRNCVILEVLP